METGRGQAALLNFSLDPYFELRKESEEEAFSALFRDLLGELGLQPRVSVTDSEGPLRAQEVISYKDGELEYVAIKRDAEVVEGVSQRAYVQMPRRAHLYDLRRGRYLGYKSRTRVTLDRATPKIISMLPYHVEEMSAELSAESFRQGERVGVSIQLTTSAGELGNHVFHMEIEDPAGKASKVLSQTVSAPGGKADARLALALNDPVGTWRVVVRDVATGTQATATFEVRE